jgi:hypothetical protein
MQELCDREARQRRVLARLVEDAVAGDQGCGKHVRRREVGIVPGRDVGNLKREKGIQYVTA